ncbi:suppressor of glycerol defect, partial [Ascosphaera pollenicola]
MAPPRHNTTQLSRTLREELGLPDNRNVAGAGGHNRRPASRKELRKAEKAQKRGRHNHTERKRPHQLAPKRPRRSEEDQEDEQEEEEEQHEENDSTRRRDSKRRRIEEEPDDIDLNESDDLLDEEDLDEATASRNASNIPRSVQERLAEDDAEIARLEKLLGIKGKKKLPKSFAEDGLDELLGDLPGGLGAEEETRKREENDWLAEKRRKAQGHLRQQKSPSAVPSDEADDFEGFG